MRWSSSGSRVYFVRAIDTGGKVCRSVVMLACSFVAVSGCARARDGVAAWVGTASETEASPVLSETPQRFMVLNVAKEDSKLRIEGVPGSEAARGGTASSVSGPITRSVSGQIVINPEDLSRTSGILAVEDTTFLVRRVRVTGPKTLAGLAAPGSQVNLVVAGELVHAGATQSVELELSTVADIKGGELNGLKMASVRPLRLAMGDRALGGPPPEEPTGAALTGAMKGSNGGFKDVSFELFARPAPPRAADSP